MKKLFTLIATAFLCLTASAQVTSLYIAGAKGTVINGQTLADWDIVNTIEVQLNRGKFTLDCKDHHRNLRQETEYRKLGRLDDRTLERRNKGSKHWSAC